MKAPVEGSNPTWTRWTKLVGRPIGDDKPLRRYISSRHVYNSEFPGKTIETLSVGDGDDGELGPVVNSTTRQLCRFTSGSTRVSAGRRIFLEADDA